MEPESEPKKNHFDSATLIFPVPSFSQHTLVLSFSVNNSHRILNLCFIYVADKDQEVDVRADQADPVDGGGEGEGEGGRVMCTITGVGNKTLAFANREKHCTKIRDGCYFQPYLEQIQQFIPVVPERG